MSSVRLPTPHGFRFAPTVVSHGWSELPPFSYDNQENKIERILSLNSGRVVKIAVSPAPNGLLRVRSEEGKTVSRDEAKEVKKIVELVLNLQQDLEAFYLLTKTKARYRWIERVGAGRMLVCPTVWEDMAKTMLTTNTTWNVTVQMCRRLVELGDKYAEGGHSFPSACQVANVKFTEFRDTVRAGYRSEYLYKLATDIAGGTLDVEQWRNPEIPSEELYRRLLNINGFGKYAAGTMLRLLGRFDRLGIDTSSREVFRVQLNRGRQPSDAEIHNYYERFGNWRGLAFWMDTMRINLLKNLRRIESAR